MRHFIASLIVALLHGLTAYAQQVTFERSYDYGYAEAALAVIQTADGGYLMAGRQGISVFYAKGLLIKTDAQGNVEWQNSFYAGCDTYIHDVKQLDDGGYVLAGEHCIEGGAGNLFLARTDEFGDTLWLRSFGSPIDDRCRSVAITSDGGFVIAGGADTLACVIKTDDEGNLIWNRTYLPEGANFSAFHSITSLDDGGFAMCGSTYYPIADRYNQLYVVRADANGEVLWERQFGEGENEIGESVAAIPGGGVYAAGLTWSFGAGHYDMYLIRLADNGDTLWTTTVGSHREETAMKVFSTPDGGAVMVGTAHSGTGANNGKYGLMAAKVSELGELQWSERFERADNLDIFGYGGAPADDGGYVFCGMSYGEAYLVKADTDGRVVGITDPEQHGGSPSLYPNPATEFCTLTFPESWRGLSGLNIDMIDMAGRTVLSVPTGSAPEQMSIPLFGVSAGMYSVRVHTTTGLSTSLKLMIR